MRLKGGGEDAAGGAICFALLSTIMAAAAPELESVASGASTAAAAGALAGSLGGDGGLQLSPVSSGDLSSAAPYSISPAKGTSAALQAGQLPAPAMTQQQQRQGLQGQQGMQAAFGAAANSTDSQAAAGQGGLRGMGMLSRLTGGAAAAAGTVAASVASAVQNSTGSSGRGLPLLPASSDGKPGGGMLASLSWMQQQLAEGLSLRSSSNTSSGSTGTRAAAGVSAGAAPGNAPKAAAAASPVSNTSSSSTRPWPKDLPDKLLVRKALKLQSEPLTAVAAAPDGSALFVAGHNGLLRVLDTAQLATHRSMKLENTDLLCISLLPTVTSGSGSAAVARAESPAAGGSSAGGSNRTGGWEASLPMLLAGAQSGRVLAYAATAGRMVGSWAAHDDAVSAMLQLGHSSSVLQGAGAAAGSGSSSRGGSDGGGCRLVTASWDCSVKVWDVAEGRQPWSSTLPMPLLELRDLESGVWALGSSASGQLLVTGTEEGVVAAWDLRTRQQIWSTQVGVVVVGQSTKWAVQQCVRWRGVSTASRTCEKPSM